MTSRINGKKTHTPDSAVMCNFINTHAHMTLLFSCNALGSDDTIIVNYVAGRPGSSEVTRNPLTRWDVSSIPANGIFLTKKLKNKNRNAQRVENDYNR